MTSIGLVRLSRPSLAHLSSYGLIVLSLFAIDCGSNCNCTDAAAGINGCATFVDDTQVNALISFPGTGTPHYTPSCLRISPGQTVTWQGDLAQFPLSPFGGEVVTPIVATSSGSAVSFTFPNVGTYGFRGNAGNLLGAVDVR